MTKPNVTLSQIRLLVDDYAACRDFYRDVLGLEMSFEAEGIFAQFIKGDVTLGVYPKERMAEVLGSAADNGRAGRDAALISFQVENVDEAVEELQAKGVRFLGEPKDQEAWFMRVAYLRDPDGNLIELFHSLAMEA